MRNTSFDTGRLALPASVAVILLVVMSAMKQPERFGGPGGSGVPVRPARPAGPTRFGIGRAATAAEIAAWDISIRPDGRGLPPGSGNTRMGGQVYAAKCAACHGKTGKEGPFARLVGPMGDTTKAKTIGNYWPYATTIFDYTRRAMPYNAPGSLTATEVYGLTAWLLAANRIIDSNEVMDARRLPAVVMPAKKFFVPDDRRGGPEIR
jgi:S-disulfanyl-L-cysteine oxidoreductase SoxD